MFVVALFPTKKKRGCIHLQYLAKILKPIFFAHVLLYTYT
jgi:hypothetical protein